MCSGGIEEAGDYSVTAISTESKPRSIKSTVKQRQEILKES
jgi:hypothetical protein